MKRFLILALLLAVLLLVARAAEAHDDASWLGPTTERSTFFEHGVRSEERSLARAMIRRRTRVDSPRRVGESIRFALRDRDYAAAWIETDADDWRAIPMQLDRGADRWTIELELPRGRTRYVFVVEDRDGDRRVRTDTANERRRRGRDREWVSEVLIGRDGDVVERSERSRRRSRHRRAIDIDFVDDVFVRYQRVDGFVLGAHSRIESRDRWSPRLDGSFSYGFSSERGSARVSLLQPLTPGGQIRLHLSAYDQTATVDRTGVGATENSLGNLLFREDAYDWFRREGLSFGLEWDVENLALGRIEFRSDDHASLDRRVIAGWGGRDDFLPNPAIDDGVMRSIFARVRVGSDLRHLWVEFEASDDDIASSDFQFTQLTAQTRHRLRIGRDAHFDLRLRYGTTLSGTLPRQRRYLAGGIGTVRGLPYQSLRTGAAPGDGYGGEQLLLANAELMLGDDDMRVALFADAGQVWIDRQDDVALADLEASLGVGLVLDDDGDGLRVDLIRPLEGDRDLMVQLRLRRPF